STIMATRPRLVVAAFVEPNSPAAMAGITRGAKVLAVDGVDVTNGTDVDTLNAGLFPDAAGASHTFSILDLNATTPRTVTMVSSSSVQGTPVQAVKTIPTATGLVGYFQFDDFNNLSEVELISAVN